MDSSYQVLFLVLVIYSHMVISSYQHFETQANQKIKDAFIYLNGTSKSVIHCAAICARNKSCMSTSYNDIEKSCRLSTNMISGSLGQDRITVQSPWTVISKTGCPVGWNEVGKTCYYFGQEEKNYTEANKFCEEIGGRLAEPRTNATFELLRQFLLGNQNLKLYSLIGLNNLAGNGTFVWNSNGALPTYTAWLKDEPYDYTGYNCTVIPWYKDYKWISKPCDEIAGQICEMIL